MDEMHREPDGDISQLLGNRPSSGRGKRIKGWIVAGLLVLSAALVWGLWDMRKGAAEVRYRTQPVKKGDLTVTVTATGNLQPTNRVEVGSELSGIVREVKVDFNDRVTAGQVLAELDTAKLRTQVLQSKAGLESARAKVMQAQATIKQARSNLERLKHLSALSGSKAVSRQDLDGAEADLARALAEEASAKAAVGQAKAMLEANETDLSKAAIRSPFYGVVLSRSVEPGQTVAASLQAPVLFTLAEDLTRMELHVDVDEADVGRVKEGQQAVFTVDAFPERRFPARISQVRYASKTVEGVVTYETVLTVDNADLALRPGMTATAEIVVEKVEDALLVPNAALRFSPEPKGEKADQSGGGGLMSRLFPRPPGPSQRRQVKRTSNEKQQRVWTLSAVGLAPVAIRVGITDGTFTQVVDGPLQSGMELVVAAEEKKG